MKDEITIYLDPSEIYKTIEKELHLTHEEQLTYIKYAKRTLSNETIISFLKQNITDPTSEIEKILYEFDENITAVYDETIVILQNKLLSFFNLCDLICLPDCDPNNEKLQRYDIKLVNGKLSTEDVIRIAKPIIHCFNKLQKTVTKANDLQNYFGCSIKREARQMSGITNAQLLPPIELQFEDPEVNVLNDGVIPLTNEQILRYEKKLTYIGIAEI